LILINLGESSLNRSLGRVRKRVSERAIFRLIDHSIAGYATVEGAYLAW
jgi:hypothetical protein